MTNDLLEPETGRQEREHPKKDLLEHIPLGLIHIGSDGVILNCNLASLEILRSTRELLVGFDLRRYPDGRINEGLEQALGGTPAAVETGFTVAGVVTRTIRAVFSPVDPGAKQSEVILLIEDVTDRKRAEDARIRCLRAAEDAHQALAAIVENMNREVRTPLSTVIGLTALLLDTELSLEQRCYADLIRKNGLGLFSLFANTLDYTAAGTKIPTDGTAQLRHEAHPAAMVRPGVGNSAAHSAGKPGKEIRSNAGPVSRTGRAADTGPSYRWAPETKVLLAEDNEVNQLVTGNILKKIGLSVDIAVNGREAVDALARRNYDLVLMDCQMPEMSGFEATARIRSAEKETGRSMPIIALTSCTGPGDRERCLKSGMDDYLAKPVQPEALVEKVLGWLDITGVPVASAGRQQAGPAGQQSTCDLPVFDRADLLDRFAHDGELAREIMRIFLRDMPGKMEKLISAVEEKDLQSAYALSHLMKGAAANVAGKAAQRAFSDLELAAGTQDAEKTALLLDAATGQFLELCRRLGEEEQQVAQETERRVLREEKDGGASNAYSDS